MGVCLGYTVWIDIYRGIHIITPRRGMGLIVFLTKKTKGPNIQTWCHHHESRLARDHFASLDCPPNHKASLSNDATLCILRQTWSWQLHPTCRLIRFFSSSYCRAPGSSFLFYFTFVFFGTKKTKVK